MERVEYVLGCAWEIYNRVQKLRGGHSFHKGIGQTSKLQDLIERCGETQDVHFLIIWAQCELCKRSAGDKKQNCMRGRNLSLA